VTSLLEAGALPVEELALLASREGWRPRPIYGAHKWFARRFGSAFRGLLTAAHLSPEADFWGAYYEGVDYVGRVVLDPFVGGGTSVVEAARLGANVIGVDIDRVACAITEFELRAGETPDLKPALTRLKRDVGEGLAHFYETRIPDGQVRPVLHYFWVQVVECVGCGRQIEAHPHYQLAHEAEGTRQWVFCSACNAVETLDRQEKTLRCGACGVRTVVPDGVVRYGRLTCPDCKATERLIEVAARKGRPPEWRLFALEILDAPLGTRSVPLAHRRFQAATAQDQAVFDRAQRALESRSTQDGGLAWIPEHAIPRVGRADGRLPAYGYVRYRQLFNPRQLLHLSLLAEQIAQLRGPVREAMAIAFSDHLTTNCMLTYYAFGWRRLAPLFTLRAYRHVTRPVELNPWLDGTGRGTFPNAVRQVQRAAEFARAPRELRAEGGSQLAPTLDRVAAEAPATVRVLNWDARDLSFLPDCSVDLALTDPPYFDNIAYSELSDFFVPWLELLEQIPATPRRQSFGAEVGVGGRDAADNARFGRMLACCFQEVARVLKPEGWLIFTFQHKTVRAWDALASALAGAGFQVLQVFPMLGDSAAGLHNEAGSSRWDAVFVCRGGAPRLDSPLLLGPAQANAAAAHCNAWANRLMAFRSGWFRSADRANLYRASLVAAALGMFPASTITAVSNPLAEALAGVPTE
jgi:adenine-specific DNA methylase